MKTVLCYGDSNTYGYDPESGGRYPGNERWTGILRNLLGPGYRIIEEGCNGRTTVLDDPDEPWKNGKSYLKACLNTHKPVDIVCMMLGSNDLKTSYGASVKEIAEGAGKLVDTIYEFSEKKQLPVPVVILMCPPEIGEDISKSFYSFEFDTTAMDRSREFPKEYKRIADERNCLFFNAAEVAKASKEDSLHLTEEGHRTIGEGLAKLIKNLPER
ncbi:MAG: SGNH/GDSL hydrolase family protein [Firmicutes bacterium]|nr:SGNH/GDSL hydrolase family protein [Bacillota bacterium]